MLYKTAQSETLNVRLDILASNNKTNKLFKGEKNLLFHITTSFIFTVFYTSLKTCLYSIIHFWIMAARIASITAWKRKHELTYIRQFSHVTKRSIFKNLNLRKKAYGNFRGNFLKNHFRHVKFYSNPPSWLARSRYHMGIFWKKIYWSSHFWDGQPFRFWYVEIHLQRKLRSTKTDISS